MKFVMALAVIVCVIASSVTATPQQPDLLFKDIKPILDKRCLSCHGESYPGGKLRLDSYEGLMKGGTSGKAVIPKNSAGSRLMNMDQGNSPAANADGRSTANTGGNGEDLQMDHARR